MNIKQLKAEAGVPALVLDRQLDRETKKPTEWMSHWEDGKRLRISMTDDTYEKIKAQPERNDLVISKKFKDAVPENGDKPAREEYMIWTILVPNEVVDVL